MEERNEILATMKAGFARMDERFAELDARFGRVDEQFRTLRAEFAEQLDGVSRGLHLELKAATARLERKIGAVGADVEKVDSKVGLIGENTADVMTQLARYHANVEVPLEQRVTKVEAWVLALEGKKER